MHGQRLNETARSRPQLGTMSLALRVSRVANILILGALVSGCSPSSTVLKVNPNLNDNRQTLRLHEALADGARQSGMASWYGRKFHGRPTANGERFDMHGVSAAHKTLPFGTLVEVHNLDNGNSLQVRVNDRGPFVKGRIIDLSRGAAEQLGLIGPGVARVELDLISWPVSRASGQPIIKGPWVQAGAFRDLGKAETLALSLRDQHRKFDVYSDDGWHRVQARLKSARDARKLLGKLHENGIQATTVRR